ncbi:hypothetical protein M405DRAFT_598018 [Rhizopogon salebrosus TDB-379]|nr:hypothetical protein M405DRAFT_598018 [Rhizopogon salebrosus TDB-379]
MEGGLMTHKLSKYGCLTYFMLYTMTHTGFFLSLLCLGSSILEASLGGHLDIYFFVIALGSTFCVILFALYIRDSPEANVHLITGCAAIVFLVLLGVSIVCAWRIYN